MKKPIWLAAFILMASSCYQPNIRVYCRDDGDCGRDGGPVARCLFDGDTGPYCANMDNRCPSGYRWDEYSNRDLMNKCVDPSLVPRDGGT